MEETDKQATNSHSTLENEKVKSKISPLLHYQWKKGQSGNLKGRPKGITMKEYVRDYLSKMTDEERDEWLEGIPKIDIFKMAEGNPKQDTGLTDPEGNDLLKPLLVKFIDGK